MRRINRKIQLLRDHGFEVENFVSLIQNDNDTDTIVYTSEAFQPMAETFSDRYAFVGPSIQQPPEIEVHKSNKKTIYISLGTVLNQNRDFFQNCFKAFAESEYEVVMSVGDKTDIASLGKIPENFTVKSKVDQIAALRKSDVFITHCGMNSVNESLYFGVPMVLFPLHSEQRAIADRVAELEAGIRLRGKKAKNLTEAVATVLGDEKYQANARILSISFHNAGGAAAAANMILQ